MSKVLRALHEELRLTAQSDYNVEFDRLPFLSIDHRWFMMDLHPHNPRYLFHHTSSQPSEYMSDFEYLRIENDLLENWEKIKNTNYLKSKKNMVVKVVKKLPNNIYCITISPNPQIHQDKIWLHRLLRQVVKVVKVVRFYGVFEIGKSGNYHTHFLLEYVNDKNCIQNLRKFLNKINQNGLKEELIYKYEKVSGPIHLLKCLRYFEKSTKNNCGYFMSQDGRKEFYTLTNTEIPELNLNPEIII